MVKILNFFFILLVFIFFLTTYKYYSSNKNIEAKNFNRKNIDKIINAKILDLPVLENNTNNVIEFNNGFSNQMENDKPRSFWNLLRKK